MVTPDIQLKAFGNMLADCCNRERIPVRLLCEELSMSPNTFENV